MRVSYCIEKKYLTAAMISIITPLLNEEGYVKLLLDNLTSLEGEFELILVDGGSRDRTLIEVERYREGFFYRLRLFKAPRGRWSQMNKGAETAEGEILLFLHADCSLEKDALLLIEKAVKRKSVAGGGFQQCFLSSDLFLKFQSYVGNIRAKLTGIYFGDYGIFMRKDVFEKIKGYDNLPFLEDVELCKKAKKCGKLIQIDRNISTSPRRYFAKGKVRLTVAFVLACLFNTAGIRPRFLVKYIADK
jgi:rSAM/selenodomain-associated transferase 2